MWTLAVVVLEEVDQYVAEVAFVADHEPVEVVAAHRLHESFCARPCLASPRLVGVPDGCRGSVATLGACR
jgi:hypothetical protein